MDLLNMLTGLMTSSSSVDTVSQKTGNDSGQTKDIISTALPMLLGALTNNASSDEGANSLMSALQQHTSTASIKDQLADADEEDGSKIIGHILGDKTAEIVDQITKKTGTTSSQVTQTLSNIAPSMLSSISAATGAAKKETEEKEGSGLDISNLLGLLGGGDVKEEGSGILGSLLGGLGGILGGGSDGDDDKSGGGILDAITSIFK